MRIILFSFSFFALLIAAALIGPSFVDWNKYKPQIVTQVENATGLNVQINGDLSLAILPYPSVKIKDLVVASPKKIQFENLLSMKSAEVSVALLPLLEKQIKVSSVTLIEPDIQIEIMADGTPSWTTDKIAAMQKTSDAAPAEVKASATAGTSSAMDSIALEALQIKGGKIAFINHATAAKYSAQDINLDLEADSLSGPFEGQGSAVYQDKKITLDFKTGKLPKAGEALKIQAEAALPDADAMLSFDGLATITAPFDVQGQAKIEVKSPAKLAKAFGSNSGFDQSIMLDGLLSADENKVQYDDLKLAIGDFVGNGKFSVQNLKSDNPMMVSGAIKSASVLDIDKLMPKSKSAKTESTSTDLAAAGKAKTAQKSIVPQTLTLPMAVNGSIQFDVGGVKAQGQTIKGVFLDLNKNDKAMKAVVKALELPGQSKLNANLAINYASASSASKTGQVTYSDPTVTYDVNGQIGEIATFMGAFAPDVDVKAVTKLYKNAQFDLKGNLVGQTIALKDSTLKLDQLVLGLAGKYVPATNNARAKAVIDVSAGEVDFDKIMAAQGGGQKAEANNATASAAPKEALKRLQGFSLPLDLTFDISLQKARINNADLEGLRLAGDFVGKQLTLTNASVNNFAGATINLKGQIANLSDLSGLDLTLYTKTSDVKKLASALKVDTSKLPADLNAVEASVSGKGSIESLGFNANIKAMSGQLDVAGNATDLLGTPAYNNLSIGLNHPNLVKAIQIVSPEFAGQAGLAQPINLRTQANIQGKKIDLSNLTVKLGQSDFSGNLKIDASGKVASVRGNIQAGEIALDSLLGAKSSGAKSSAGGGTSAPATTSERWSKAPIDLAWMNSVDVDVALSASSITYGAWNFTKPSTDLKIGNGQMVVNDLKAGVFGGTASLSTEVKASPVSLNISSKMDNIDLEKLVKALSGSSKLQSAGTVSFDVSANATGNSANALINALNGQANLDGRDVTLKGFDLVKLARGLSTDEKIAVSALNLVDGAMSGGQTKFDTLKGDYKITNGLVVIQSMAMENTEALIASTGSADLPKWFINVDNTVTLKNVEGLEPFVIKLKGPLNSPTTLGTNILQDYVQSRVKNKLVKELPGVLGSDATKALQQFGILPQDKAPAVTPTAPVDGVNPEVAPDAAPVLPEQKKIEKPADALEQILQNPDNPEEALKGVLKGFF